MTTEEKQAQLRAAGIISVDDPQQIVDTIKQPVKVSANFMGDPDGEINTIWAEQADYLTADNVGEGLVNKPEWVRDENGNIVPDEVTYSLNVKLATKDEIGGIKLPEDGSISIDNNGGLAIDFNTIVKPATSTTIGGVKPQLGGLLQYNEADGTLTASYELPTAGADVKGGVMVGKIRDNIDPSYANRNLRMEDTTQLSVFSNILNRYTDYDNINESLKQSLDYILVTLMDKINQNQADINTLAVRLSKYFDRTITVAGALLFGKGTFKSTGKGYAEVQFDVPLKNNHYHVCLCQLSSSGRVGELSATLYTETGFRVYNTGSSSIDTFVWMVIPSDITYAKKINVKDTNDQVTITNKLPIKRGTDWFNGSSGKVVSLDNSVMYCSSREGNKLATSSFPIDEDHGNNGDPFENNNYIVLITPSIAITGSGALDSSGKIGEIWVENKTSSSFTVKCSGTQLGPQEQIVFDWVAIPYGNLSDNESTNPFLENASLHHDEVLFPIRCGSIHSETDGSVLINFNQMIYYNTDYLVFAQLTSDTDGHMGEYSVDEYNRARGYFEIIHSGAATDFTIDWIAIDVRKQDEEALQ